MDMRTRETASRPNHQPLPANLDVSVSEESVSNPLAVSSFEINAPSGTNLSASDPLAVKPCEINASSGLAEQAPFFVKKSKAAGLSTAQKLKGCFYRPRLNNHKIKDRMMLNTIEVPRGK